MLKIKECIDLKVLEKYGFELKTYSNDRCYTKQLNDEPLENVVCIVDRTIGVSRGFTKLHKYNDLIYDLITNGLIDKVEE